MSIEPLEHHVFEAADLFREHPPQLDHPNKRLVYRIAMAEGEPADQVIFTRWATMTLPTVLPSKETRVEVRPDIYDYEPVLDSDVAAREWHVNFADPNLFVAYGSGLFAQDEIQAAEHPILGSVREALIAGAGTPRTEQAGQSTPILLEHVERRCAVATAPDPAAGRPAGLYGNRFAAANAQAVEQATRPIRPPTRTHLIAMAAPTGGVGRYSATEIQHVLSTAYAAFNAARCRSADAAVAIHTGFWGCGAFGGNRVLMPMLQLLAAQLAEIDVLVFHAFDQAGVEQFNEASRRLADLMAAGQNHVPTVLSSIKGCEFEWGVSDGN